MSRVHWCALLLGVVLSSGCMGADEQEEQTEELSVVEQELSGTVMLRSRATGGCLEALGSGALPRAVSSVQCRDNDLQRWRVQINAAAPSFVTFINVQTGLCLDSNASKQLYTFGCNGGGFQKWQFSQVGTTLNSLKNKATGFCLDGAGGAARTAVCNGADAQRWAAIAALPPPRTKYSGVIRHGGSPFEAERVDVVGDGLCSPGFARVSPPQITHEGHGWCAFDGWENPFDFNDCRAKIRVHDSAAWLWGNCNWAIFEQ